MRFGAKFRYCRLLDMGFGPKVAEIVNIIENPTPPVVKDSAENNFGMGNPWATENATEKKEDEPPKEKLNKTIKFTYEDDEAEEEEAPPALNGYAPHASVIAPCRLSIVQKTISNYPGVSNATQWSATACFVDIEGTYVYWSQAAGSLEFYKTWYVVSFKNHITILIRLVIVARVDIEAGQEYDTPTHLKQYYCVMRTKERLSSLISLLQQCAEYVDFNGF